MPSLFTEDTYEQAIIELFENMGYDHLYAPELDRDTRCVNAVERRMRSEQERQNGHLVRNAIATLIFTFLAFAIAQFGLLAVVKQGYAYLGYAAFITLFIPFIIHVIVTKGKEI